MRAGRTEYRGAGGPLRRSWFGHAFAVPRRAAPWRLYVSCRFRRQKESFHRKRCCERIDYGVTMKVQSLWEPFGTPVSGGFLFLLSCPLLFAVVSRGVSGIARGQDTMRVSVKTLALQMLTYRDSPSTARKAREGSPPNEPEIPFPHRAQPSRSASLRLSGCSRPRTGPPPGGARVSGRT